MQRECIRFFFKVTDDLWDSGDYLRHGSARRESMVS